MPINPIVSNTVVSMPDDPQVNLEESGILQPLIQLRELLLRQVQRLIDNLGEELEDSVQQEANHLENASEDVRRRLNEQRLFTSILVWAHAEITEYDLLLDYAQNDTPCPNTRNEHPLVETITDILRDLTNSTLASLDESKRCIDDYLQERNRLLHEYILFNNQYLGKTIVNSFESISSLLQIRQSADISDKIDKAQERLQILHREIIVQSSKVHDRFTQRAKTQLCQDSERSRQRVEIIRLRLQQASDNDQASREVQDRLESAALQAQSRFDDVIIQAGQRMEKQTNDAFNRYLRHLDHAHAHIISTLKLSATAFAQTFQACQLLLEARLHHHATVQENLMLTNAVQRDHLTRLHNRTALIEHFPRIHATAMRSNLQLNLLFLDLDGFKAVNDDLGHHAGDLLLQQVAERMRAVCREGDMICRLGGDEFIILATSTGQDDLAVLGRRLVDAISEPYQLHDDQQARISVSIGIAVAHDTEELKALICRADSAMYVAKQSGKNQFQMAQGHCEERPR
jgi:diguanylate cyclase (GGDEF)-like protein